MTSTIVGSLGKAPSRLSVSPTGISLSFFTIARSFGLIVANFMGGSFRSNHFQYLEAVTLTRRVVMHWAQKPPAFDTPLSLWHKKLCLLRGYSFRFAPAPQTLTRCRTF